MVSRAIKAYRTLAAVSLALTFGSVGFAGYNMVVANNLHRQKQVLIEHSENPSQTKLYELESEIVQRNRDVWYGFGGAFGALVPYTIGMFGGVRRFKHEIEQENAPRESVSD